MKARLGIRWQLFSVVTPVAVVPIILIVLFTTIVMFRHLEERSKEFYASVMQMLAGNIDYTYEQYGRTFTNAVRIPSVDSGLNAPPYSSKLEERDVLVKYRILASRKVCLNDHVNIRNRIYITHRYKLFLTCIISRLKLLGL